MKFTPKQVKKHQQGGPVEQSAPAPEEQMAAQGNSAPTQLEDPLMMLAQGAMQALLSQDCQIAMQVCDGLVRLIQQATQQAPQGSLGEPIFKKGGVLSHRIKK